MKSTDSWTLLSGVQIQEVGGGLATRLILKRHRDHSDYQIDFLGDPPSQFTWDFQC